MRTRRCPYCNVKFLGRKQRGKVQMKKEKGKKVKTMTMEFSSKLHKLLNTSIEIGSTFGELVKLKV